MPVIGWRKLGRRGSETRTLYLGEKHSFGPIQSIVLRAQFITQCTVFKVKDGYTLKCRQAYRWPYASTNGCIIVGWVVILKIYVSKKQDGSYPVSSGATVTELEFSNGIWGREMQIKTKVRPRFWTTRQVIKPNDSSTNIKLNYILKKLVTCSVGKLTLSLRVIATYITLFSGLNCS